MGMTFRESVIWAAAFIDGEGSFSVYADKRGKTVSLSFAVQASQKDRWALDRLKQLFGGNILLLKRPRPIYYWQLYGSKARGAMMMLYPFMSPRRQKRIREILSMVWFENGSGQTRGRNSLGQFTVMRVVQL